MNIYVETYSKRIKKKYNWGRKIGHNSCKPTSKQEELGKIDKCVSRCLRKDPMDSAELICIGSKFHRSGPVKEK